VVQYRGKEGFILADVLSAFRLLLWVGTFLPYPTFLFLVGRYYYLIVPPLLPSVLFLSLFTATTP